MELDHSPRDGRSVAAVAVRGGGKVHSDYGLARAASDGVVERVILVE